LGKLGVPLRADGATATAVREGVINPSVCASSEADGSERDCRVCASSEADGSERDCTDSEADGRARDCASSGADSSEKYSRHCEYDSEQNCKHCEPDSSEDSCRGIDGWKQNAEVVD